MSNITAYLSGSFEHIFSKEFAILDDKFKICTISNQLAKGLEFDAVIINNACEHIYSSQNNLDMKLLYVAITRALHELYINYTGELTKPLQSISKELVEENKIKGIKCQIKKII